LLHEGGSEGLSVLDDLLGVLDELVSGDLLQLDGKGSDGRVVWSALESWEHSKVDGFNMLLLAHDDTRARSSETLVSGGGDHIAVLEWLVEKLGGDETAGMGDIGHEVSTDGVSDLSHSLIIVVSWVGTGPDDEHLGLELSGN